MTEIVFIGTGEAFGSGGRRNSAILVRAHGRSLLMDCGPATLSALKNLGIDPREIDALVVTHFHGDHIAGIPFLLLDDLYENPRSSPLTLLGPPGIEERVWQMCKAFSYPAGDEDRYKVSFQEFSTERSIPVSGFDLRVFPAHHQPDTRPHMLQVSADSRAVFYTGDTGWHEELPGRVGETDLFISECTLFEPQFQYHLSHEELDQNRSRFRCKRVVLTHLGSEVLGNRDRLQFDTVEDGQILRL